MNDGSSFVLKTWPAEERPREKLIRTGPEALSNMDLLAIILHTGTVSESAVHLSERILSETKGLARLSMLTVKELSRIKGIGLAKAATIVAAFELGRRLGQLAQVDRFVIHGPKDAADYMMPRLRYATKEHFIVLLLSTKNHVVAQPTIAVGSLNAAIVHPREVFREAINHSAAAMILIHNHPSGDPKPSREDIDLTKQLVDGGKILDIAVLDHVIIGDGKYVSLKEQGIIE